jgi:RNA polymerase sigma-70 factor (ECF subfamily)
MSIFSANRTAKFEEVVLPHLDAAYNLARWLTRNEEDAKDVVQEACLRALKFVGGFKGENSRSWFLSIVRNTAYTMLKAKQHDMEPLTDATLSAAVSGSENPQAVVLKEIDIQRLREAVEDLPLEFREVIVLREFQELSYEDVAKVAGIPIGTVMSRLARARARLHERLTRQAVPVAPAARKTNDGL